jgi:hypothetical protein
MVRHSSLLRSGLLVVGAVGLTVLGFAGCGGQTTPGSSNQGKDAACAELCAQRAECDGEVDAAECTEACTEDEVLSRSGQDLLTTCFASDECEVVDSLDALACLEDGLFDLPLTEAQEDFCTLSLERIAECGGSELGENDVDNCLSGVGVISEEFATELSECGERRTCELVNACVGLKVLTSLDEDQLEQLLGESGTGGLGSFGGLEDLFGSIGGSLGGAGPG